jgi:hypothetical protein
MALLLKELSNLEVEQLNIVVDAPESEQDCSLDTLTTAPDEVDVAALLTGTLPVNRGADCCCCLFCCYACC